MYNLNYTDIDETKSSMITLKNHLFTTLSKKNNKTLVNFGTTNDIILTKQLLKTI